MATNIFPKTHILVKETNITYMAYQDIQDETIFTCSVELPANTEAEDKVYTLELFSNDLTTNITTPITVLGTATEVVNYVAESMIASPSTIASTGGTSTVTIKFSKEA